MKRARLLFLAIGFVLLFAGPSSTSGQVGKPESSATPDASRVYTGKEVDKKARVLRKPEPKYTKDARKHGIEGTVILRVVFASTGRVTNIHVVSGLPDGLTDRSIEVAQKIKFEPAIKDGHPVSMWFELQYNYHLF
jgi:TonB family protein